MKIFNKLTSVWQRRLERFVSADIFPYIILFICLNISYFTSLMFKDLLYQVVWLIGLYTILSCLLLLWLYTRRH